MNWRAVRFGLMTVLGLARRGFFIPYRHAKTLPCAGNIRSYDHLSNIMAAAESDFVSFLQTANTYKNAFQRMGDEAPPAPRWNQDWFPTLDAAIAYTMVREKKPKRIIEVGSGHSTRFIKRAVDDGDLETKITAIDPQPSRLVDRLKIEFLKGTLAEVGLKIFQELEAGDILMIDSSHILMPGSDVDDLVNRVIPTLPSGVLIHIHDVFLPDDYPIIWNWRGYNEQLVVGTMLTSGSYKVLFASHYVKTRMAKIVAMSAINCLPSKLNSLPASLWILKR